MDTGSGGMIHWCTVKSVLSGHFKWIKQRS